MLLATFVIVHKRPGDKAALFLSLRHLFFHHLHGTGFGQRAVERRQVIAARNQRGKPFHLARKLFTFRDHAQDKRHLAPFAPQLLLLAAEVERAIFSQPQIATLTFAPGPGGSR